MTEKLQLSEYSIIVEDLILDEKVGQYFWQPEEVIINADEDLSIDETNVDHELGRMGQLLAYYGDLAARLKTQFARKEEDLEAKESYLDKNLRDFFNECIARDPKSKMPTETQIKRLIVGSEGYQESLAILSAARLYHYRIDNLVKALVKKADALNALAYNQRAERKAY